jgi:hypothetical protein
MDRWPSPARSPRSLARHYTIGASRPAALARLGLALALLLAACRPPEASPTPGPTLAAITIWVDGGAREHTFDLGLTVREAVAHAGIALGELDRLSPPPFTLISDGLLIVITRVTETLETEVVELPYASQIVHNEDLPEGERRLLQVGQTGREELTYRVVFEDGLQVSRSVVRRVTVQDPVPEIIMVGAQGSFTLVPITGTLAYINGRNAWVMRGNSGQRLPLTTDGQLDGRVFELSPDGQWLLYSREVTQPASPFFNNLWVVSTQPLTGAAALTRTSALPLSLPISNVLYAEWHPIEPRSFVYTTAERIARAPGRQANNDLWLVAFRQQASRAVLTTTLLLDSSSGGIYGWWGTGFAFAPNGERLAYARADSVGLIDYTVRPRTLTATVTISELVQFTPYNTHSDWAWFPPLRWAPGGEVIYAITHGPPIGLEAPEDSPAFDLTALTAADGLQFNLIPRAGMFANPLPAPARELPSGETAYRIAFFQAADPNNSAFSNYRLGVMDRDGSNVRFVFPPEGQTGLSANEAVAWSPAGDLLAVAYRGNLWLVNPDTGFHQQITGDGLYTQPRWSR